MNYAARAAALAALFCAFSAAVSPPAAGRDGDEAEDLQVRRLRGTDWTTFLRRPPGPVTVDGRLDEWSWDRDQVVLIDGSFIPHRGWGAPPPADNNDLSASVRLAWDGNYVYVAARVRDDELMSPGRDGTWGSPYGHDSLVVQITPPTWLVSSVRSAGPAPLDVSFGLSYYAQGTTPRPLAGAATYAAVARKDGYDLEAALPFAVLGWSPAQAGDRFPFGLILVDIDPGKPGGERFDQYGWNFGPGSGAGKGEVRLLGETGVAGELTPEREEFEPGSLLRFAGSIDTTGPATLTGVEVVRLSTGEAVKTLQIERALEEAGRYAVTGQLLLPELDTGTYDLKPRLE